MTQRNFFINVITILAMKQYIQIDCPFCQSDDLVKNGQSENGTQRYRCKSCRKSVQWEYLYRAWLPEVKQQIVEQTLNSSGVRDISRNLGIAKNTVIAELKKKPLLTAIPPMRNT
ncbi:insertion element protein [Candidatus Moduliflexus flocculans]|uniref:Insertion element protein n=1 Tax=Candidatus Moduliflexus flocculans TaxID=1499966 RepID=A0A081BS24_9BACT|nr:insertion element protein [Candidatus Moduliflexus flocculans]